MNSIVLVIDYGGVYADHYQEPAQSCLAQLLGIDSEHCRVLLSESSPQGRAFREGNISESEFWDRVCRLAGLTRNRPSDETLTTLWAQTYAINRVVCKAVSRIRCKFPIALLTNIDCARSRYLTEVIGIGDHIDLYLPSYEARAIKPSEALWRYADTRIREAYAPDQVIYIDDRANHIEAAEQYVQWKGVLFEAPEQICNLAEELIVAEET